MAKRPNPRSIKAARTYTIEEVAIALGVSTGTVRVWIKSGLPLMRSQRPFLILGDALRSYLEERALSAKSPMPFDQLSCFTCKKPNKPMGLLVDCIPQTAKTSRLVGLCEDCGGICNRIISNAKIDQYRQIFCLAIKDA